MNLDDMLNHAADQLREVEAMLQTEEPDLAAAVHQIRNAAGIVRGAAHLLQGRPS